jgi:hypothetical protein
MCLSIDCGYVLTLPGWPPRFAGMGRVVDNAADAWSTRVVRHPIRIGVARGTARKTRTERGPNVRMAHGWEPRPVSKHQSPTERT